MSLTQSEYGDVHPYMYLKVRVQAETNEQVRNYLEVPETSQTRKLLAPAEQVVNPGLCRLRLHQLLVAHLQPAARRACATFVGRSQLTTWRAKKDGSRGQEDGGSYRLTGVRCRLLPCAVRPVALAAEESQQQLGRLALVPLQHLADALPAPDRNTRRVAAAATALHDRPSSCTSSCRRDSSSCSSRRTSCRSLQLRLGLRVVEGRRDTGPPEPMASDERVEPCALLTGKQTARGRVEEVAGRDQVAPEHCAQVESNKQCQPS